MDIKSIATEAGIYQDWMEGYEIMEVTMPSLERFAALVAEATKEKAAKLIDNEEIHRGKWFATAIRSMK